MKHMIFTNNPILVEYLKGQPDEAFDVNDFEIKWVGAPAMDVLTAVRAAIHQGAALVSSPLAGVRMNPPRRTDSRTGHRILPPSKPVAFNPYLSVAVSAQQESVDFQSVKRIDEALSVYRKNARLRFIAHNDDAVNQFQMADMNMLLSFLSSLALK